MLLAFKVAALRAEALLSPDLHVELSPLNDADVRVVQLIEDALCLLLKELKGSGLAESTAFAEQQIVTLMENTILWLTFTNP